VSSDAVRPKATIDVFRYQDYRRYLTDYYQAKKARGYSYRAFAKAAGLGAPNYLRLVIDGKRNLSPTMAARFASACELGPEATDYFETLVAFNQAQSQQERVAQHEKLRAFRRYRKAQRVEVAEADYHGNWYTPVLRELVRCDGFRNDPDWIAAILRPTVRPSQVRRAISSLVTLGLLDVTEDGRLKQRRAVVSTGPETAGMHIRSYHAEMMQQAISSMETVSREERDISSLTLSIGPSGLHRLKTRLVELRRELLELAESEPEPNQVVQLNFQLFPVSHPIKSSAKPDAPKRDALQPTKANRK